MKKSFIDSKCPKCSTQQKETTYEYIWTEEWAYYWFGRKGRWEYWTKKFKVSQIIETIKLKDDDFRKREDLSPNYYQSMPISAQFEDDPGLGGDIEPGTIWPDEINVEVLEIENTDGGYHDGYVEDEDDDSNAPPHEFHRDDVWRENEKLIFKCEECNLEFEMRFPNS